MKTVFALIFLFFPILCFSQIELNSEITYKSDKVTKLTWMCSEETELIEFGEVKLISFVAARKCLETKKYYFEVLINNETNYITPDEARFNIDSKKLIKWFKKLDTGGQAEYYTNSKEVNKKYADSVNLVKEELRRIEEERLAEERRLAEIEAEKARKREEEKRMRADAAKLDSVNFDGINRIVASIDSVERILFELRLREADAYIKLINTFNDLFGGLVIKDYNVVSSGYVGTGVDFTIHNLSNQKFKYVDFYVQGYNPVGDKVGSLEKLRGIGFIEPSTDGSWSFEDVWYENTLSSATVKRIVLTYENGKTRTFNEVGKMFLSDELSEEGMLDSPMIYTYKVIGSVSLRNYSGVYSLEVTDVNTYNTDSHVFSRVEAKELSDELLQAIQAINSENSFFGNVFQVQRYSRTVNINMPVAIGAMTIEQARKLKTELDSL